MKGVNRKVREGLAWSWLVLRESARSFLGNGGFERSATLAYYCFLSLIPLLLLEVLLLSMLIRSCDSAVQALERTASQVLPVSGAAILKEVRSLSAQKAWGVVTLFILLWSATPLATAIRRAFLAVFKPERQMAFLKAKALDILAVMLALGLLVALILGRVTYAVALGVLPPKLGAFLGAIGGVSPFCGSVAILALFYRVFLPVMPGWRYVLAGSVITAVLLGIVGPAFTFFLTYNPNYGVTFGSLKAVFLLFVWVYYAFAAILFGTEILANILRREALIVRGLFAGLEPARSSGVLLDRFVNTCDSGAVLFREGDEGPDMYYVLEGAVSLSRKTEMIRTIRQGDYFGEMAMLLGAKRTMTATAAEDQTRLVRISRDNLETVLRENPDVVLRILREMAARLKQTDEYLERESAAPNRS